MPPPRISPAASTIPFRPFFAGGEVALIANRRAPQAAGTTITWTATAPAGATYEYKWLVHNGSEWTVAADWSPRNTFSWTPPFANPRYIVSVWVRRAGCRRGNGESSAEAVFAILAAGSPSPKARSTAPRVSRAAVAVSTVTLRPSLSSPQPPRTTITWTAAATGGGAGVQYKWFVYDGRRWTVAVPWSTVNTFAWTPPTPNQRYRVSVWARRAGSATDYFEACAEDAFTIAG